jgi:hypothetical protein
MTAMVAKRASKRPTKRKAPSKPRSPTAAVLAKPAFRPRVVKSKRAYTRKLKGDEVAD